MLRLVPAKTLLVLALSVTVCAANAQRSEPFADGTRAFADGDYLRALAHFQAARAAGSSGPAVQYNIAVCHYRLGDYEHAADGFQLIADAYPEMRPVAQYNLGLVRLKQGRDAEARGLFELARANASDEKLIRLTDTALRRMDPSESPSTPTLRWVSFLDISVGHDDNVALIDDSSLPAGQSVDSAFTEMVGVLSGPLSSSPGFRFDGSVYAVRYADADQFDQNAARLGGVYHWGAAAWRFEAGPHFNYSTLDGDGFEQRLGASLSLTRTLGSRTTVGIRVVHDQVDDVEPQFAFVDGSREQVGITLDRYGASGRLSLSYDLELNDRADPGVSPTRNRLTLRYRRSMNRYWAADMRVVFRNSAYDDLLVDREEDLTEIRLGFVRDFTRGWQVNGEYRWSDNDSNDPVFSYSRNRIMLGLTKNF